METLTPSNATMRTIRFHGYGEPADVLRLDHVAVPSPSPGRIRVSVQACGLNPADWALCRGLFPGMLPRGIGLELSGVVDGIGDSVSDVAVGDLVMGTPDFAGETTAGASDYAIRNNWTRIPAGLDPVAAASLPMALETAFRSLESLKVTAGLKLLVHGAGTTVGFAAVQIALMRGARVIATAGETFAQRLTDFGATVTSYGDGMVERVLDIAGGLPDLILDTAPPSGALPDLVRIAGGDPRRILTITDFGAARELGVRTSFGEGATPRYDMLAEFARWGAESRVTIPIARTFALDDWREARDISMSGQARGKLILLPTPSAAAR